jgi:hypothetical protein
VVRLCHSSVSSALVDLDVRRETRGPPPRASLEKLTHAGGRVICKQAPIVPRLSAGRPQAIGRWERRALMHEIRVSNRGRENLADRIGRDKIWTVKAPRAPVSVAVVVGVDEVCDAKAFDA